MDIQRFPPDPERDAAIKARQDVAGKVGFILGCIAAVIAVTINLLRPPRPTSFLSVGVVVLIAALNMPIGIMLGLAGERVTRPKHLRPPPKNRPPR